NQNQNNTFFYFLPFSTRCIEELEDLLEESEVNESKLLQVGRFVAMLLKPSGSFEGLDFYASKNEVKANTAVTNGDLSVELPRELDAGSNNTIVFCMFTWPEINETIGEASGVLYGSRLVGLSVRGKNISGLQERVNITMNLTLGVNDSQTPTCQFLNFTTKTFSSDGCLTLWKPGQNHVTCSCDHLTYFGVLMVSALLSSTHEKILTYITLTGCSLSLIALVISVLLFIINRKIRADVSMKVHINLTIALILLNMHFLPSEMVAAQSSTGFCFYMAFALHYSLLATFSWMALEGFHIYLLLVRVFNIYVRRYLLKLTLVGWGVPAVIVSLVLIIKRDTYGCVSLDLSNSSSSKICYIVNYKVKMVTTVGVFVLVFIFNVIMLIMTAQRILSLHKKKEFGKSDFDRAKRDTCTLLGLIILLGIPWGLVFFSFGSLTIPGLYLFCILNSLQGLHNLGRAMVPLLLLLLLRGLLAIEDICKIQHIAFVCLLFLRSVCLHIENGTIDISINSSSTISAGITDDLHHNVKCAKNGSPCLFRCSNTILFKEFHCLEVNVTTTNGIDVYTMNEHTTCSLYSCNDTVILPLIKSLDDVSSKQKEMMQLIYFRDSCEQLFMSNYDVRKSFIDVERKIIHNIMATSPLEGGGSRNYNLNILSLNVVNISEADLSSTGTNPRIQVEVPQLLPQNSSFVPDTFLPVDALRSIPKEKRIIGLVSYMQHKHFQMRDPIAEVHWKILSYISYIGCGLSVFFTVLSIVIYVFSRNHGRDHGISIHVSLSGALFLLNTTFLLTEWGATVRADWVCVFVAALMHYALLCCFTWMAIEALHLYLLLIKVFNTYYKHYLVKLSLLGWGLPGVIVAISLAVKDFKQFYGVTQITMSGTNQTNAICWITDDSFFYSLNLVYFTIIFIFNSGILIAVASSICKTKQVFRNNSRLEAGAKGETWREAGRFSESCRSGLTVLGLTCLMGTTWGLAFLGSGYVNYPILYLFCILNSTQGVLSFLSCVCLMSVFILFFSFTRVKLHSPTDHECVSLLSPRNSKKVTQGPLLTGIKDSYSTSVTTVKATVSQIYCENVLHDCQVITPWTRCFEDTIGSCRPRGRVFPANFIRMMVNSSQKAEMGLALHHRFHIPSSALQRSREAGFEGDVLLVATVINSTYFKLSPPRRQGRRGFTPVQVQHRQGIVMGGLVLAVRAGNHPVSNLSEPIILTFKHDKQVENGTCVFWQESDVEDSQTGHWSTDGCATSHNGTEFICSCNHLSFFAVLVNPVVSVDKSNAVTLSYITYAGSALSVIFTIISLIIYICLHRRRPEKAIGVHMQLTGALLCLHLIFLVCSFWVWRLTDNEEDWVCRALGLFLHWSVLATFTWTALEGFHLYLLLVRVFNIYVRKYLLKLSLVGWGLPTLTVMVCGILGVYGKYSLRDGSNQNTTVQMCWMSSTFPHMRVVSYITTLAFPCLLILGNSCMLGLVVFKIWRLRGSSGGIHSTGSLKKMNREKGMRLLKDCATVLGLSCLLGLPWGLASTTYISLAGIYVFTILNSLQGQYVHHPHM
ncbi:hypothetical protein L3Q82_008775, partial [Scortum barcoo]